MCCWLHEIFWCDWALLTNQPKLPYTLTWNGIKVTCAVSCIMAWDVIEPPRQISAPGNWVPATDVLWDCLTGRRAALVWTDDSETPLHGLLGWIFCQQHGHAILELHLPWTTTQGNSRQLARMPGGLDKRTVVFQYLINLSPDNLWC